MVLLTLTASAILGILLISIYKNTRGVFSIPFLIFLYIIMIYIGSLNFYITNFHLTHLFVASMGLFFFIGFLFGSEIFITNSSRKLRANLNFYIPLNKVATRISIIVVFFISLGISLYRVKIFGSPLLEGTVYTAGLDAVTGVGNKILFVFGPPVLLLLSIISYGLYHAEPSRVYKIVMTLSFMAYISFMILRGGKAIAVMPFLLVLMVLYYSGHRIPGKLLVTITVLVGLIAFIIGGFRVGSLSIPDIAELYYQRITSAAALHLDYLIAEWIPKNTFLYGETLLLELKRVVAQITPVPKEPLFGQTLMNLRSPTTITFAHGTSPELPVFGIAYANYGVIGAVIISFIVGLGSQFFHLTLSRIKRIDPFSFTILIYFLFKSLDFIRRGLPIIFIQQFLLEVIPVLLMVASCYSVLTLPFPHLAKWNKKK